MNPAQPDWLDLLAPAHSPEPPGWWPLAPGWWAIMILALIILACIVWRQLRPSVRRRRAALRELKKLSTRTIDHHALAVGLENLLRRYAIAHFGRDQVASLSGESWINFVATHGGRDWAGSTGGDLLRAAYGGPADGDPTAWISGARAFIMEAR
jgi:hypothetical protein